jgi:hypothetical protein
MKAGCLASGFPRFLPSRRRFLRERLMNCRPTTCVTLFLIFTTIASAAPQINKVSQRGVKIGEPVVLLFDGAELAPETRIVSSLPIKSQQVKPESNASRAAIEIVVDESAQPGIYAFRLASASGISNSVLIGVDRLQQSQFVPEMPAIPAALSGTLSGSEVKYTKFSGTKGQRVVVDIEAQRLGAAFKPLVRVNDVRGKLVASGSSEPWLGGDARCTLTLPADGVYTIEILDRLYRAAEPGHFRLKVGDLATADRVHPAAVSAGPAKLSFLGGTIPAEATADFNPAGQTPGDRPASWPNVALATGPQPDLLVSDQAEAVETAVAAGLQEVGATSVGISGVLAKAGEEDKFLVTVVPGQRLRIDMFARRIGSPVLGVFAVRNEQGGQLAASTDIPGSPDATIANFVVPANVNKIVVAAKDLRGQGGSDFNYRLQVRDLARPEFNLSLAADRILVPSGGTQVVQVVVDRQGYNGPIKLELPGLPTNIQVQGTEIAAGSPTGLLTLSAPPGVTGAGLISIVGRGGEGATQIVRTARAPALPNVQLASYLRSEIAWGVAAPSPLNVVWTPASDALVQGLPLAAKVQVIRAANVVGPIRLRLMTTQPVVKKKIKENNQDKEVDDLARILRLAMDVVVPADKTDADVSVFVPGDLPIAPWDATIVAELLSADAKNVVATAYAPVRRFMASEAIKLELTSANAMEGKAGAGPAGKLTGKVRRATGFQKPVLVTLTGLPAGYSAPVVQVAADKTDFEYPLNFPFGSPPAQLNGVQLVALLDRNQPTAARSNSIAVNVNLTAGEKPPGEKPAEIFEDDEKFLAALNQGNGQLTANPEKFAGKIALRVTPDQKFNPKLPGVEFKIRETPGPGEYRYLRYAWKKKQGNLICLQLAHDDKFGPGGSGREGAMFRYHAGPGGEPFGGSVLIDAALPGQYVVVTRDLFADFGEFTLTGLAFSAIDGEAAFFDGIYLGRSLGDFELIEAK